MKHRDQSKQNKYLEETRVILKENHLKEPIINIFRRTSKDTSSKKQE